MTAKPIDPHELKQLLKEYGSLPRGIEALKEEKAKLEAAVQGLKELQVIKTKLVQEKADLEHEVESLVELKAKLEKDENLFEDKIKECKASVQKLKTEISELKRKQSVLEKEIEKREQRRNFLIEELKPLEDNRKVKQNLDNEIAKTKASLEDLENMLKAESRKIEIFNAFLGLIRATNWQELDLFSAALPGFLKESREKQYSVELLKKYIIDRLTGKTANLLSCRNCGAEFVVNKVPEYSGYQCPVCHMSISIYTKIDLADILSAQINTPNVNETGKPLPGSK
jgi:DNA repair exonuclease SbcCD ATPase subunit